MKLKRIIAGLLAMVMLLTATLPTSNVKAASGTASLDSLGKLGTVNVGSKSESGIWLQTLVNEKPVFCMDLGKACHTGYTYKSESKTISSDDANTKNKLEAKIGYWYDQVKKGSNKAWVYAQCLIWSVEEGYTSESNLKSVINQVKKNTGYYKDDTLYSDIFEVGKKVECDIYIWKYSGSTDDSEVQKLLQIKSTNEEYKYLATSGKRYYRQRITLEKVDEDGTTLPKVTFRFTAKNIKELYSYQYNGWGDSVKEDADEDATKFSQDVMTDSNGKIVFRFTYVLNSKKYYYVSDDELSKMSTSDKKQMKDLLDDKGYNYASDLSKAGAEKLKKADLAFNETFPPKTDVTGMPDIRDIANIPGMTSGKKHILVIDDDVRMLKVIKLHLHEKYDVATAISGKIALKFLETKHTDLILLDYAMPDENGLVVLEKLRANPLTKDIPVIFLTGITDRKKIQEALVMKPQGYLLKPINRKRLLAAIQNTLEA